MLEGAPLKVPLLDVAVPVRIGPNQAGFCLIRLPKRFVPRELFYRADALAGVVLLKVFLRGRSIPFSCLECPSGCGHVKLGNDRPLSRMAVTWFNTRALPVDATFSVTSRRSNPGVHVLDVPPEPFSKEELTLAWQLGISEKSLRHIVHDCSLRRYLDAGELVRAVKEHWLERPQGFELYWIAQYGHAMGLDGPELAAASLIFAVARKLQQRKHDTATGTDK